MHPCIQLLQRADTTRMTAAVCITLVWAGACCPALTRTRGYCLMPGEVTQLIVDAVKLLCCCCCSRDMPASLAEPHWPAESAWQVEQPQGR